MSPPTSIYPTSALPKEINTLPNGKPRKPPISSLRDCPLKEMVQYKCNIEKSKVKGAQPIIVCDPVVRLFRVCQDGLHVETTVWEGMEARREEGRV